MKPTFEINLAAISLDKFRDMLALGYLVPSRLLLREEIEIRFQKITENGIHTLEDLLATVKSKPRYAELISKAGLSEDYATLLKREVQSYIVKPMKLSDLTFIDKSILDRLSANGIVTTKDVFELIQELGIERFIDQTDLAAEEGKQLECYADLSRVIGMGPQSINWFYNSGIRTVKDLLRLSNAEIIERLNKANSDQKYSRIELKEKDIQYCRQKAEWLD
jgi:hypothetical protein